MADQVNQDPFWHGGHLTGLQLRDLIIAALNENSIKWPMTFKYISIYHWCKYMNLDSAFYLEHTHTSSVFHAYERLLLDLASKLLKRKICLISLFPEDKDEVFEPPMLTTRTYFLLGCNKAYSNNFYVSIFKHESNIGRGMTNQKPLGLRGLRAKISTTLQQWDQN